MLPPSLTELDNAAKQSEQRRLRSFQSLALEMNQLANDPPMYDPEVQRGTNLPIFALSEFLENSINFMESE